MSGLVLKIGPGERLLINGAVIQNGDRRARMTIVTPDARILRLRDAIDPEEVNTPVRRVCYIAQLALSGDADEPAANEQLLRGIEQLGQVFRDEQSQKNLTLAAACTVEKRHYQALKALRALLPREQRLMEMAGAR